MTDPSAATTGRYTRALATLLTAIFAVSRPGAQEGAPTAPAELEGETETESESKWLDPFDGWFDVSRFLEEPHGFLPVVVPITEPALGYGAFGAALFLDPREEAGAEGWSRPNMTMVGGLWTEDGSDGLVAANSSLWGDGDLQTLAGAADLSFELELHGIGDDRVLDDQPLDYRIDLHGVLAEGRYRLGGSKFWVALRFLFAEAKVDFGGATGGIPAIDPEDDESTLAGPALSLRYDSLDNLFTPTRGTLSDTTVSFFDDAFGGTRDFQLLTEFLVHHWPLAEQWFLGARGQLDTSFGDVPFYARPFIVLRGVPLLRYQGEHAASAELELRWQFHPRISAVGFGGVGEAWTNLESFDREQSAAAQGVGLRYLVARKFGLHAGLDFAHGPEENAVYVQFGNAWVRP